MRVKLKHLFYFRRYHFIRRFLNAIRVVNKRLRRVFSLPNIHYA